MFTRSTNIVHVVSKERPIVNTKNLAENCILKDLQFLHLSGVWRSCEATGVHLMVVSKRKTVSKAYPGGERGLQLHMFLRACSPASGRLQLPLVTGRRQVLGDTMNIFAAVLHFCGNSVP